MFDVFFSLFVIVDFMSNFIFLKDKNQNFFNLISEAEKLFRDEYFEQSIIQTRRFAENICRDLLQEKASAEDTFDSMVNKIKDNSFGNMRMTEFTDDLYFLKKHGNTSVHSSVATKDGTVALECLERSFEISIFYYNIKYGYNKKLDKAVFSEEVLMTGKASVSNNLQVKYSAELNRARKAEISQRKNKISKAVTKKTEKMTSDEVVSIISRTVIISILIIVATAYFYSHIKVFF